MFGHDDHHSHVDSNNDNAVAPQPQHVDPTPDGALSHDGTQPAGAPAPAPAAPTDTSAGNFMADDNTDSTVVAAPAAPDEPEATAAPAPAAPAPEVAAEAAAPAPSADADALLQIKQQALQQLSPLVGHLDQTPEEKFRTTMMMIQAADNDALIKDAYEAAQAIPDEKARAQALLDIVNEINYFTQQATTSEA